MNLLAFDTSTEYLSLAIDKQGERFSYDVLAGQSHSQLILPQIQALLDQAGLQLSEIEGIAFGAGPGSFTGVRIAAGVAQGLGFGGHLPVVPIGTLLALAESVQAKTGVNKVIACLDARMGEVYHAAYEKVAGKWQVIIDPGLYKPQDVPVIPGEGWVGAGSGWKAYADQLSQVYAKQLSDAPLAIQPDVLPYASAILALAKPVFLSGQAGPAHEAMPVYIRNRVALKTAEREQGLRL